jgi:hypothetical protein
MIKTEYFALTNETIESEFSEPELKQREIDIAEHTAEIAAQEAKAEIKAQAKAAAQAKLAALGLTVEDLQALGL